MTRIVWRRVPAEVAAAGPGPEYVRAQPASALASVSSSWTSSMHGIPEIVVDESRTVRALRASVPAGSLAEAVAPDALDLETKEFLVLDEVDRSRYPTEPAATLMLLEPR